VNAGSAASARRAVSAQLAMELRLMARRGENLLVTLVIPLAALLFFGSVDALPLPVERPIEFLLAGCIALAIIATSFVSLGIATAYERQYGVLKRLGDSPLGRPNLIAAKVAAVLLLELVQVVLLIATAVFLLGWVPPSGISFGVALAGIVLGTAAFAGLGLLLAGSLRAEATLAAANGVFLMALLLGGIIVPLSELPSVIASVSRVLPAAALSDVVRAGLGAGGDVATALGVLAVWAIGSIGLAIRFFRWA
jgi:ABC-2 type transport system permease protein